MLLDDDPARRNKQNTPEYFQSTKRSWLRSGTTWACFVAGIGIVAFAISLEQSHLPIWYAIALGYLFFLVGGFNAVGCWLSSNYLRLARKRVSRKNYRIRKWGMVVLVLLGLFSCEYAVYQINYEIELRRMEGVLEPACERIPVPFCGATHFPEGMYAVQFGDGSRATVGGLPTMIFANRQYGPIMGLFQPRGQKNIALYMDVLDKDGKVIARFDESGKFIVSPGHTLSMERKDKSSLKIIDDFGEPVLDVHYANPQFIKISGLIRLPGHQPFVMGFHSLLGDGIGCLSNGGNERTVLVLIP